MSPAHRNDIVGTTVTAAERRRPVSTVVLLAAVLAVTIALYSPIGLHDYSGSDDTLYVSRNETVSAGLTPGGARWAFTTFHAANWHPLTWLCLMAETEIFGNGPGGLHLVSLFLHAANVLLLYAALSSLTGDKGRSLFAASLFALHPLNVEPVAWISSRKDLLSAFFFLVSLAAYGRFARSRKTGDYLLMAAPFVLGLLCKPMLVTFPFVLLLLDHWPLGRTGRMPLPSLVVEKIPLIAVSVASSAITLVAQGRGKALAPLAALSPGLRVANAVDAYATYLRKIFWPDPLAIFYPYPQGGVPPWRLAVGTLVLAGISAVAVRLARSRPSLFTGWFWFVGMLVPVIGLIQVGQQAMADRYVYLPAIGAFIALAWGVAGLSRNEKWNVSAAGLVAACCALALAPVSAMQIRHWEDEVSVYSHAVDVTQGNSFAHTNLALALGSRGKVDDSNLHFEKAFAANPTDPLAMLNMSLVLKRRGKDEEERAMLERAVRLYPEFSLAHFALGALDERQGREDDAIGHYREAVRGDTDTDEAHCTLGLALARRGNVGEALLHFSAVVRGNPGNVVARYNLALALELLGRQREAESQYRALLRLDPGLVDARNNLGILLSKRGAREEAVHQFREILKIQPGNEKGRANLKLLDIDPDAPAAGH